MFGGVNTNYLLEKERKRALAQGKSEGEALAIATQAVNRVEGQVWAGQASKIAGKDFKGLINEEIAKQLTP